MRHQERECHKAKKGCITAEDDDYQFGPWLRVVGPKFNRGRNSFSKTKSGEVEDDIDLEYDEEEGDRQLSPTPHRQQIPPPISKSFGKITAAISLDDSAEILGCQPPPLSMTSEANTDTAKQLLEKPRKLRDLSKSKVLDPIQFSSFERDGGVPESVTPKNKEFPSLSKSKE